jgi:hypothetical protein
VFTVKSIPVAKPGRHHAGETGLYLEVSKDGKSRRWLFRYISPISHKPTEAGGKTYPLVGLQQAREWTREMRRLVAEGIDPVQQKREEKAADAAKKQAATTFDGALTAYAQAFAEKGATTQELESLLRRHVPALLSRPLATINTAVALEALAPVQRSLPKTAARVRAAIATVSDYALARGMHSGANPASVKVFKFLLPTPPKSVPHRMMPFDEIPAFYARLTETPASGRLCLA